MNQTAFATSLIPLFIFSLFIPLIIESAPPQKEDDGKIQVYYYIVIGDETLLLDR